VKSLLVSAAIALAALPLSAGYAARDLVVPVAGRAVGPDGRSYLTALWITNASDRPADVALTFHPAALNLPPISSSVQLAAGETKVLDPYDPGAGVATGWIRLQSTRDLLVTSRLYSRLATQTSAHAIATTFSAIPLRVAIGNGDAAMLQGLTPADTRYKLYFDEVSGQPLEVWVTLLDLRGAEIARTHLYIDAFRQVAKDAAQLFPKFTTGAALLRVAGMHGRGRVIVAGSSIATISQDASGFEMSFATSPRDRIGWTDAVAYFAIAIGIVAAISVRRR